MANEKVFTPEHVAIAVLSKVSEVLQKSELAKSELIEKSEVKNPSNPMPKGWGKKDISSGSMSNKGASLEGKAAVKKSKETENKKAPSKPPMRQEPQAGESEHPGQRVHEQKDPQHNAKEQAEGNNELAGTTPTQDGPDKKALPGFDEMASHLKLAKFIGRMHHKRELKSQLPR